MSYKTIVATNENALECMDISSNGLRILGSSKHLKRTTNGFLSPHSLIFSLHSVEFNTSE